MRRFQSTAYASQEACGLFETFDIVLATAGDSLVRHMTQALMTIMIDDYQKGGMRWWDQDEMLRETCQCDLQLRDEPVKCRFNTMANYGAPFPEFEKEDQREKICPQWSRNRVFFLPEAGPVLGIENTGSGPLRGIIRDHNTTRLFVYLSFGLHLQFDWGAGKTGYLDSLWAMLGESKDDGQLGYPPHAFLVTAPYPGPLKDTAAFPRQARPHVLAWNEHLREFQAQYTDRSTLIDYAPLSDNSTSPDGTHFTQSTNVILAQMVLNYMAAMSYDAPTTPTHDVG